MSTSVELRRMLQEAEAKRMAALLDAWNQQIEAAAEAAADRKHEIALLQADQRNEAAARERQRIQAQMAADAIASSHAEQRLYNQMQQALAGYDVSASIPDGVSVASAAIIAVNDAELMAMFEELHDADNQHVRDAQHSAAWAMKHGFVPHPNDLATIARPFEKDGAWGDRFATLGRDLDALVTPTMAHARIKADIGGARLDVVKATVEALAQYSPSRAITLVRAPQDLAKLGTAPSTKTAKPETVPATDRRDLKRVLDGVFR
ncbi:MAG: hypothetical protein RMA76_27015 [Deltaproteobacteria bacterium]